MNTTLKPVIDNIDKHYTYKTLIDQLNKSIEAGFYFESLFLEFAMMEDRLRSILYYSKVTKKKDSEKPNHPETQEEVKNIFFSETTHKPETHEFDFKSIAEKREMVESLIKWSIKDIESQNQIQEDLKMQYQDLEIYLPVLEKMKDWCSYRNKLIHAIFDKNIESITIELRDRIIDGKNIAAELRRLSQIVKNKSTINN